MIDFDLLQNNTDYVTKSVKAKKCNVDIEKLLKIDQEYKEALQKAEAMRAEKNTLSSSIAKASEGERKELLAQSEQLKKNSQEIEKILNDVKEQRDKMARAVPNIPFEDVPVGDTEDQNVVLGKVGETKNKSSKNYLDFSIKNDLVDIERASKVSGTRFAYLKKELVLLEFALANLVFEELTKKDFTPINPPVLINEESMKGLGYLDKNPDEVYKLEKDNMYLVATAEHSIVPMFAGETLEGKDLPLRFIGFSSAFRREAGSYGKDTKGILRVHQFDKLEMVSFTKPSQSRDEHKLMLEIQETLVKKLDIPYQIVHICTGDMGFSAASQYDIECYVPSEQKYRETHSTSNTTDFQARRLNIKYKDGKEKSFAHILNGTAIAIGRMLIAIIENHMDSSGKVILPKELARYTKFETIPMK